MNGSSAPIAVSDAVRSVATMNKKGQQSVCNGNMHVRTTRVTSECAPPRAQRAGGAVAEGWSAAWAMGASTRRGGYYESGYSVYDEEGERTNPHSRNSCMSTGNPVGMHTNAAVSMNPIKYLHQFNNPSFADNSASNNDIVSAASSKKLAHVPTLRRQTIPGFDPTRVAIKSAPFNSRTGLDDYGAISDSALPVSTQDDDVENERHDSERAPFPKAKVGSTVGAKSSREVSSGAGAATRSYSAVHALSVDGLRTQGRVTPRRPMVVSDSTAATHADTGARHSAPTSFSFNVSKTFVDHTVSSFQCLCACMAAVPTTQQSCGKQA